MRLREVVAHPGSAAVDFNSKLCQFALRYIVNEGGKL
jgi:hypothetical protein